MGIIEVGAEVSARLSLKGLVAFGFEVFLDFSNSLGFEMAQEGKGLVAVWGVVHLEEGEAFVLALCEDFEHLLLGWGEFCCEHCYKGRLVR